MSSGGSRPPKTKEEAGAPVIQPPKRTTAKMAVPGGWLDAVKKKPAQVLSSPSARKTPQAHQATTPTPVTTARAPSSANVPPQSNQAYYPSAPHVQKPARQPGIKRVWGPANEASKASHTGTTHRMVQVFNPDGDRHDTTPTTHSPRHPAKQRADSSAKPESPSRLSTNAKPFTPGGTRTMNPMAAEWTPGNTRTMQQSASSSSLRSLKAYGRAWDTSNWASLPRMPEVSTPAAAETVSRNGAVPTAEKKRNRKRGASGADEPALGKVSTKDHFPHESCLFVGDIPRAATEEMLLQVFGKFGDLVNIDIKKDKLTNNNLGYAFVHYRDNKDAEMAMKKLQRSTVGGRTIRVGWAQKNTNLFIANLDPHVTSALLRETFTVYGPLYFEETFVKPNGVAFVKFKYRKDAAAARRRLDGKAITMGDGYVNSQPVKIGWGDANTQRNCVHVQFKSNTTELIPDVTEADFRLHFEKYGHVLKVSLPKHTATGVLKGYAFVHFSEDEDGEDAASRAIAALSGTTLERTNTTITCNFGKRQRVKANKQQKMYEEPRSSHPVKRNMQPTFSMPLPRSMMGHSNSSMVAPAYMSPLTSMAMMAPQWNLASMSPTLSALPSPSIELRSPEFAMMAGMRPVNSMVAMALPSGAMPPSPALVPQQGRVLMSQRPAQGMPATTNPQATVLGTMASPGYAAGMPPILPNASPEMLTLSPPLMPQIYPQQLPPGMIPHHSRQ